MSPLGVDVDVPQRSERVVDDLILDPPEGRVPLLLTIFAAIFPHRGWAASPVVLELGQGGEDAGTVQAKITKFDSEFDLVLIAEYFDESLVLLAQILCWDLSEVRSGYFLSVSV